MTNPDSNNTSQQSLIFWPLLLLFSLLFAVSFSQPVQASPQVDAGADRTVALPADTICLTGAASGGSGPLSYSWVPKSEASGVVFTDPNSLSTSVIFPGPGSYTLTLSVTDGATTVTDDVNVSVAKVIRVPEDASTIQGAINLANNSDIVLVAPGTYVENPVLSKSITLASYYLTTHDTAYIGQTIIDGNGGLGVVSIPTTASPGSTITGLTIRNGSNGIDAYKAFSLLHSLVTNTSDGVDLENGGIGTVIRSNTLENNNDDAVDFDKTNAGVIEDNIISNNHDDGIEMRLQDYSGPPTLQIIIRGNKITGNGEDGIQLIDHTGASNRAFYIENNLIQGNIDAGLGLMSNGNTSENFEGASITDPIFLTNNTFANNNHGISGGDNMLARNNIVINSVVGLKNIDAGSSVSHTLLWNNSTNSLSSNLDALTTIISNPILDLNFYPTVGSPAIDAGIDVGLPYQGSAPDIGFVETPVNGGPAANAGADIAIALPNTSVNLIGLVSDDGLPNPPGALSLSWTQASGACGVTFDNTTAANTTAVFPGAGTYDLKFAAGDGQRSDSDEVRVTVAGSGLTNYPPSVNAGFDQEIALSTQANLTGSASDDGLPGTLTLAWTKADGPGTVTFGNASSLQTTASFSVAGTYQLRLTASDGALSSSDVVAITVLSAPTAFSTLYLSTLDAGTAGGVAFEDEDIIVYNTGTGTWSLFFDGSDVGLGVSSAYDVDAFFKDSDGSLLLSFTGDNLSVGSLVAVADEDIVRFNPTSLGDTTAGSFVMYFDGSDVGLTQSAEDIDALGFTSDGKLLISTTGSFSVTGASGGDEDLVVFTPTSLGTNTSGTWALYFDGSDVGLNDSGTEDINGVDIDSAGNVYLTTLGAFSVAGLSGGGEDVFRCTPATLGSTTSCSSFTMTWDGSLANRLPAGAIVDGMQLSDASAPPSNTIPTVVIGSPANNSHFVEGASITFTGTASDAQDAGITAPDSWIANPGGVLCSGNAGSNSCASFSVLSLSLGQHIITASATNSNGNTGSASITVFIDPAGSASTIDARVTASEDDAEQFISGGPIDLASSDLEMTAEASTQTVGMRFNAIAIPPGATIVSAYVQFQVDEASTTATALQISGEATDNAAAFNVKDILSRTLTTALVPWTPPTWPTVDVASTDQRTPNIAAVIQEIVNRPGWTSGNSLVMIVNGAGKRVAEAYNGVPSAAPLLHVEFTPPSP